MTLLELLVVLMILSVILTAAVKTWDVTLERGRSETTARKLKQIVNVIVGDPDYIVAGRRVDFGFVGDIGRLPENLQELAVDWVTPPESSRWRGPYIRSTFNESPDGFRIDGWGDTIIYSRDGLFVRSLGGRGNADTTRWQTVRLPYDKTALANNDVEGQIVDIRGMPPPYDTAILGSLSMKLEYPREGKLEVVPLTWPLWIQNNGSFGNYGVVPQGTHRLTTIYNNPSHPPACTTTTDVTVYPGIGAHDVKVRLNVDWNDQL